MNIGEPLRRGVAVPEDEPISAPEPAAKPVPRRRTAPAPVRREKEPA